MGPLCIHKATFIAEFHERRAHHDHDELRQRSACLKHLRSEYRESIPLAEVGREVSL